MSGPQIQASMAGAIESIVCSRSFYPEGMTLYVEHSRVDGTRTRRSKNLPWKWPWQFVYYAEVPDVENIIWSECFSSVAFDPDWPMRDYIPVVCDVFFRRPNPLREREITAHLRINRVGIFNLPLHDCYCTCPPGAKQTPNMTPVLPNINCPQHGWHAPAGRNER